MRVALACAFHESNSFAPGRTGRDAFSSWCGGAQMAALAGTQTVTGGFLDGCREEGIEAVPALHAWATPSAVLERAAFDTLERELRAALAAAGPVNGLLLELHGAMVAEGVERADLALARAARAAVGAVPIVAVIDPHANLAPELADVVDVVLAYRTNPHVDMWERGRDGVRLLRRAVERGGLTTRVARAPVIAAPIAQATADEPLAGILARARELEREDGVAAVSVCVGFAYADVEDLGMHVAVVAERPERAAALAAEVAELCWERRAEFVREALTPARAIELAVASEALAVLADTGDNVGGGAPGDTSGLIAAALGDGRLRFAACICDPAAVRRAAAAGVGAELTLDLGCPALRVEARVDFAGAGRYRNRGPLSAGVEFDMGEIAVLHTGRADLVVQTRATMANDQELFAAFGVPLDELDAVLLKGAAAVRAGWRDRDPLFLDVATPGVTSSDLAGFAYRRAPRPLWPLDA